MKSMTILITGCAIGYAAIVYLKLNSFASMLVGVLVGIAFYFEKEGM